MINTHCKTWNMEKKLENVKNETQTMFDLEYGEKHSKIWKIINAHCRTWSMALKLKSSKMRNTHFRT
jgi:hypothetical protein